MASIAFNVVMTDGTTMTRTATVADGDVARIVNWALNYYATEYDGSGSAIAKTAQWAIHRWVEAVVSNTFQKVSAYEQSVATAAALAAVAPSISVTIA